MILLDTALGTELGAETVKWDRQSKGRGNNQFQVILDVVICFPFSL
jgi:hypothetical protein